jgi:hypothetical protein
VGEALIPQISRFANSQNSVRASDFFANHEFHRRMEEISRRILARSTAGSQVQSHWYYERSRGQHLNDQSGMTSAKRKQFLLINPRKQLITKTDLAKVECCFNLEPDVACKGAEKAFVAFAERITKEWAEESIRPIYGDEWFKAAVARVIFFRAAEACISNAPWYEGGYRAQIVAYTCAGIARLAMDVPGGASLNYVKIWNQQSIGPLLERQIGIVGEAMARVLHNPPLAGRNISEWAKQQACRKRALETPVDVVDGFGDWTITKDEQRANEREQKASGVVDHGLDAVKQILARDPNYWISLRNYCRSNRLMSPYDEKALIPICHTPCLVPTDSQAIRVLQLVERAVRGGWRER